MLFEYLSLDQLIDRQGSAIPFRKFPSLEAFDENCFRLHKNVNVVQAALDPRLLVKNVNCPSGPNALAARLSGGFLVSDKQVGVGALLVASLSVTLAWCVTTRWFCTLYGEVGLKGYAE